MHIRFVGEADDGISVSSHHARALAQSGVTVSVDTGSASGAESGPRADVIHLVTFEQRSNALLRRLVAARMGGAAIVRYWTGRDVLWATYHEPTRDFARALVQLGAVQACRTAALAEKLAECGVVATPIPVVSAHLSSIVQPRPMPSAFTVLSYLPRDRRGFHGGAIVEALVRRLPAMRFLVLGETGEKFAGLRNVESLGVIEDIARAIQRATVVIDARLDGALSRLMLEAMCHGRHVVSGYPLPHGHLARTVDEFAAALRSLRREAAFNLAGREYVCCEHDQYKAVQSLRRILDDAVEPGRLNLAFAGGVRGAAAMWRNPHLLGQRRFPLPDGETLPPEADPLRALLRDASDAIVAVSA
jgi:hypothetical protein